jgi:acyl-CoA dehydrogenase
MAVTDPAAPPHARMTMFLVPTETPGINVQRWIGTGGEPLGYGMHAYVRYEQVRIPRENLLGGEGQGFLIAQTTWSDGRSRCTGRSGSRTSCHSPACGRWRR